jgi:hypothetical protein
VSEVFFKLTTLYSYNCVSISTSRIWLILQEATRLFETMIYGWRPCLEERWWLGSVSGLFYAKFACVLLKKLAKNVILGTIRRMLLLAFEERIRIKAWKVFRTWVDLINFVSTLQLYCNWLVKHYSIPCIKATKWSSFQEL